MMIYIQKILALRIFTIKFKDADLITKHAVYGKAFWYKTQPAQYHVWTKVSPVYAGAQRSTDEEKDAEADEK